MSKVVVMDHPLIQHKIGIMRRTDTGSKDFRTLVSEVAMLECYEATRDLKLTDVEIDTPICHATVKELKGKKLAVVPILRAGLGMVDGMLAMIPAAKVGHIGLYRDPETLEPVEYYCKLPDDCANREVFVVDPMLATGGSSAAAIQMLKDKGVKNIHLMVIIAAPEGVKKMQDIRLVALDLDGTVFNDKKEITPRTLAAIRNAVARGVAVLPATGRTASGIPAAFTSIPGVRYALTSNGASVVDLTTGEQLVNQPFGTEQALKIYDLLEQGGGMMSIFIGGKSYTTRENAENHMDVVPENLKSYFRTTRIEVDDMHATLRTHAHEIEKYSLIYHDEAERDAAWRAIEAACPGMELTSSLPGNMEINAPGVTKGSGLLALAAHLGLRREQTMAVGDSGNDRAMVEAAGLGVAMGNATDDIKEIADATTDDNNHDGVAKAIEKYVL